jgi:catechol 2,3-dioxygenase-like lactoylglutathione lyase family enzyme
MTIVLNHTIVPVRDKSASARFFAKIFGLKCEPENYFAPVRLNDQMTLLFSDETPEHESHHYAFHVSDAEFDAIFDRIKAAGLTYGSDPGDHDNRKLNTWGGGRGVYFKDPDGHLLELMTVPQ